MATVKASAQFYDLAAHAWREEGDTFDVSDERADELVSSGLAEPAAKPRRQRKATTKKD